ncbi:hypothetical protein HALLA_08310 [Halostagnicola larsenii XH-48]|uniref:Uncharacterized protein n=1 Tax=Halostagnicola larsenii XH-48 TaxID=797299 RepID=W0JQ20_9EURY|nr:hypothetical protein [Halostagnicola larsenii]AHG00801.1 hypothetical protein HALLA_08310 [Halostagnicola larsenii XH-48]
MIATIGAIASIDVIAATQRAGALGRCLEMSHHSVERTVSGGARDEC